MAGSGVAVRFGKKREVIRARGGVVLSAGAFGSPQILMLSGIGPAAHLAEHGIAVALDKPTVGDDLQDHIDFVASWATESKELIGDSLGGSWRMLKAIIEHRRGRTGIMTTPFAEGGGFWRTNPSLPAADIQYHFVPAMLEDHGRTSVHGHGFSVHACVLRPESRGWVRLASADPASAGDQSQLPGRRSRSGATAQGARLMQRICEAPPLTDYQGRDRNPIDLQRRCRARRS
jgi:choline dehydrogenase-like flavoprotein